MSPAEGSIADYHQIRIMSIDGHVGFDTLADQLVNKTLEGGITFNVMCIGETGLGKSTLLDSLFNTNFDARQSSHDSPSVTLETNRFYLQESDVRMKLMLVESVGYGDQINMEESYKPIVEFLDAQFESYLEEELNVQRCLSSDQDTRIHACLYFISPTGHGMKPIDILCMKQLDKKVNLIPLIAKADTISSDELPRFKERIREDLKRHGIQVYEFPKMEDGRVDTDQGLSFMNDHVPFAIVGSNEFVMVERKMMRARQYPWGTVEVENDKHCDFTKLREVLIRSNMEDLRELTNFNYEVFRRDRFEQLGFNDMDPNKGLLKSYEAGQYCSIADAEFASDTQSQQDTIEKEVLEKFMRKLREKEAELKRAETETKWDRLNQDYDREKRKLEECLEWLEDDISDFSRYRIEHKYEQLPPTGGPADTRGRSALGTFLGMGKKK